MDRRDEIIRMLRENKSQLQVRFGVVRIGLFGSLARGQARGDSDVDVVVDMPADLSALVGLKAWLETAVGGRVDLVRSREHMNPQLRRRIDEEAVYA
jgi:uncharacterized protein